MLSKKNKNKFALVSTELFREKITPLTISGKKRTHDPIFVTLSAKGFEDWLVVFDDIELSGYGLTFSYNIVTVPPTVSDDTVFNKQAELSALLREIFESVLDTYLIQEE